MPSSSESIHVSGGGAQWANMLEQSASSIQTGRHKYITNGEAYVSESKEGAASLEAITSLSGFLIEANKKTLEMIGLAKEMTPQLEELKDKYTTQNLKILENTEKLINARAEKREKSVFLNAARVVSCLSSFILIGIPFFLLIRNEDKKFAKEIEELRDNLKGVSAAEKEVAKIAQEIGKAWNKGLD